MRIAIHVSEIRWSRAGPPRGGGGGQLHGHFALDPTLLMGPKKDQYTLIEQSNNLLKQSLHIFALGPSSSLGCPGPESRTSMP